MPKSQFLAPKDVLTKNEVTFTPIPSLKYEAAFDDRMSKSDLISAYEYMATIREFETALAIFKKGEAYRGVKYRYNGALHSSVGQEAAAVGQAFALSDNDVAFGTHRNHADVIARGLRAADTFDEKKLLEIIRSFNGGKNYDVLVNNHSYTDIRELTKDFLLYSALSEIFGKANGFQGGIAGSMHMFFIPFGNYPNNAIVGASAPIATGAALYKRINRTGGAVVANIGDGALGSGVVYESMNFAAMDQFNTLWKEKGGLPILFAVSNNGYGMGGQTRGETMAYGTPSRLAAGVSPTNLYAERVDGMNFFAVYDAFTRKFQGIKNGTERPAFLDVVTYRYEGHSQSDKMTYRDEKEVEAWREYDPLKSFPELMIKHNKATEEELSATLNAVKERIERIAALAANDELSPVFDFSKTPDYLERIVYSDRKEERVSPSEVGASPRIEKIKVLKRSGINEFGKIRARGEAVNFSDCAFEAVYDKYRSDKSFVSYGEELRDWGGMSGVYNGLTEAVPYERLFNAPISEAAIVSTSVGYAMMGGRALIEIMFADFTARAMDEIMNQLAKWRSLSNGEFDLPVTLRVCVGASYGAQHSQDVTSILAHIPGLKIVYPATPYDEKGLLCAALNDNNPVIVVEHQRLYGVTELFRKEGVPKTWYEIPIGEPDVKVVGKDLTIITLGASLYTGAEALKILQKKGVNAELIDLRSVVPLNYAPLIESAKKTGRVILLTEENERGSFMKEVAEKLYSVAFDSLKLPIKVIGAKNTLIPQEQFMRFYYPTVDEVVSAAENMMN